MAMEKDSKHATDKSHGWLDLVRETVESLRYGVVHITIHDGRVTQIEKTEKRRLDTAA
ncbi:MAG: YezD family protein [Verrucomicrobiia bacterium]